jgi:hypothetical protein
VSVTDGLEKGPFEEANSKLAEGLKSCRAVLNNYRSLLASDLKLDAANEQESQSADPTDANASGADSAIG